MRLHCTSFPRRISLPHLQPEPTAAPARCAFRYVHVLLRRLWESRQVCTDTIPQSCLAATSSIQSAFLVDHHSWCRVHSGKHRGVPQASWVLGILPVDFRVLESMGLLVSHPEEVFRHISVVRLDPRS